MANDTKISDERIMEGLARLVGSDWWVTLSLHYARPLVGDRKTRYGSAFEHTMLRFDDMVCERGWVTNRKSISLARSGGERERNQNTQSAIYASLGDTKIVQIVVPLPQEIVSPIPDMRADAIDRRLALSPGSIGFIGKTALRDAYLGSRKNQSQTIPELLLHMADRSNDPDCRYLRDTLVPHATRLLLPHNTEADLALAIVRCTYDHRHDELISRELYARICHFLVGLNCIDLATIKNVESTLRG